MTYIRLICNNEPKQWHDCTDDFIKRMEEYIMKKMKKADVWVQYQDGRRSITHPH